MDEITSKVPFPPTDATHSPAESGMPSIERGLRLWPAVLIVVVQWGLWLAAAYLAPATPFDMYARFFGPPVAVLLFLLWWLFFSRARWGDRLLLLVLIAAAGATMMYFEPEPHIGGFKLMLYALPVATAAWTVWLLISARLPWSVRRAVLVLLVLAPIGFFALLRMDGVWGNMAPTLAWRWSETAEARSLAEINTRKPAAVPAAETKLTLQPGDWPGFRGPERDARLTGVRIATDWSKHPPKLLWKQRVGPGWSSFAVVGSHLYTQEQRGDAEVVVCYDADTGKELWLHRDSDRFTEPVGGAGPRATPTFHDGKLYTVGAKGKVNCLDAATGKLLWSNDLTKDTGAKVPQWAFSSSPLVLHGLVTVFAGGEGGKAVQAYDAETGKPKWAAGEGTHSYSSPQRSVLCGIEQILISTDQGLTALDPIKGEVLWNFPMSLGIQRVVQPALIGNDDVLFGTPFAKGTRRLHVAHEGDKWNVTQVWETRAISPYFNDMVIHQGHLYGFDGDCLTCVDLKDGKRRWKERGYGTGQLLLLADQDLLLVLAEGGDIALVSAKPDALHEVARASALEGKTWNHPVLAHDRLFVRNSEEMACYRLTPQP